MCVCVCVWVWVCVMYVWVCVWVCVMCVGVGVGVCDVCALMRACVYARVCMCVCTCVHALTSIMHVCVLIPVQYTFTHEHVYSGALLCTYMYSSIYTAIDMYMYVYQHRGVQGIS